MTNELFDENFLVDVFAQLKYVEHYIYLKSSHIVWIDKISPKQMLVFMSIITKYNARYKVTLDNVLMIWLKK